MSAQSNLRSKGKWIAAFALVAATISPAFAQATKDLTQDAATQTAMAACQTKGCPQNQSCAPGSCTGDTTNGFVCQAACSAGAKAPPLTGSNGQKLSPADMLKAAATMVANATAIALNTANQLKKARSEATVVSSNCISDKYSQINAANNSMTERQNNLTNAVTAYNTAVTALNNDLAAQNYDDVASQYQIMTALAQNVQNLSAQVNSCAGQDTTFFDNNSVTVQIDPTLPDSDDATPVIIDVTGFTSPPQCTSCTL